MRLPENQKAAAVFNLQQVLFTLQERLDSSKSPPLSVDVAEDAFRRIRMSRETDRHGSVEGYEWISHVFEVMRSREARREKRRLATKEEKTA